MEAQERIAMIRWMVKKSISGPYSGHMFTGTRKNWLKKLKEGYREFIKECNPKIQKLIEIYNPKSKSPSKYTILKNTILFCKKLEEILEKEFE